MRDLRRLSLVFTVGLVVIWGGSALAEQAVADVPVPVPPAEVPASAPPPPAPDQVQAPPSTAPQPSVEAPAAINVPPLDIGPAPTPWPWPFPWVEEATKAGNEAAKPGPGPAAADAAKPQRPDAPRVPTRSEPGERVQPGPDPGLAPAPVAPADIPATTPQPTPVPDAVLQSPTNSQATCSSQAIQNGVTGDTGTIVQVMVLNSDCTWSTGQALVAYDVRGPPVVDVLVQSAGLSMDVETLVRGRKVRTRVGYIGADGAYTLATPAANDPLVQATQTGDNRVEVGQDADTESGNAISGSQRVRVDVDRDSSAIHVLAQNASPGASAASGDAVSSNDVVGVAGPQTGAVGADSQAGQAGNNDVELSQSARSKTGRAVAGSQEIEVRVAGSVRELGILASNASPGAIAVSGDAISSNNAVGIAGPNATSLTGSAQSGQVGSNHIGISQQADATSGDAIAGSQVVGVFVTGRVDDLAVLAANDSTGTFAQSGSAVAVNTAGAFAGPRAAGPGGASSAQLGDNDVLVTQFARAQTGDAISGTQVVSIAVLGGVGHAAVLPANSANLAAAFTGAALATNVAVGTVGPQAFGLGVGLVQQRGSNSVALAQDVLTSSGDALAATQVVAFVDANAFAGRTTPAIFD